jgi:large subunit ribosomal protein L17
MRHHNHNRKFGRETDQRRAFLMSLTRSLVLREKITTTEARAKEIRPIVEKLVTRGKSTTALANKRLLISRLGGDIATAKKVALLGARYQSRAGGYLRITKLSPRKSDGARMARIEFV